MRIANCAGMLAFMIGAVVLPSEAQAGQKGDNLRRQCSSFGYQEGTDAFADCMMKLTLKQERDHPDHDTLIRKYRQRSMERRGDDRYPVCTAGMMDNELDTSTGKWVGPDCQMQPD